MAHKNVPPATASRTEPGRRTFFQLVAWWGTIAVGAVAAVFLSIPLVGYLLGALYKRKEIWVPLAPVASFPVGETLTKTFENPLSQPWDGETAHAACFVRNLGPDDQNQPQFQVFAVNCAHLGCPVSWFPQSGLFMCPCHGGVYYANGDRASGPPPQGLYRIDWRVKSSQLEIKAPHLPTLQDPLIPEDQTA
jgi:Rieske Fe-S protein